jgi:hypothetical protein
MKVSIAISDLYFNHEKGDVTYYDDGSYDEAELFENARHFLELLDDLGVNVPFTEALIEDFKGRI